MLTLVRLVCRQFHVESLSHVVDLMALYLLELYVVPLEKAVVDIESVGIVQHLLTNKHFGKHFGDDEVVKAIRQAAAVNNVYALRRLFDYAPDIVISSPRDGFNVLSHAASLGHEQVVRWICAHQRQLLDKKAIELAIRNGHLGVVRVLCEHRVHSDPRKVMQQAVQHGQLAILEFLTSHFGARWCLECAILQAVCSGRVELVAPLEALAEIHASLRVLCSNFHSVRTEQIVVATLDSVTWLTNRYPDLTFDSRFFIRMCGAGSPALVQWLMERDSGYNYGDETLAKGVTSACCNGNMAVIKFFRQQGHEQYLAHCFKEAMTNRQVEVVRYLYNECGVPCPQVWWPSILSHNWGVFEVLHRDIPITIELIIMAAREGSLQTLKLLLHDVEKIELWREALETSIGCCNLEAVEYLYHRAQKLRWRKKNSFGLRRLISWMGLCSQHYFEVVQFLIDQPAIREDVKRIEADGVAYCIEDIIINAARYGAVRLLRMLDELQVRGFSSETMTWAADGGYLSAVSYLHFHHPESCSREAMNAAASKGFLHIVKFLHFNRSEGCTTYAMDQAAANGHVKVVEFLHLNRPEGCTTKAIDRAASKGHADVVEFLHFNRSEGCTTDAMDRAAAGGHVKVVEFLHLNRYEGCTALAMDDAAASGHLKVVEFLHCNRSEGCTTYAMDRAAAGGHVKVVEFLHVNRSEGCTTQAMDDAAANGHVKVVEFLHCNRPEGYTSRALEESARYGHVEVVKLLRFGSSRLRFGEWF